MGAVELSFALLFGAALGGLAAFGRGATLPAWAELFAPGAMGWVCGVQGVLFNQEADYMLAYLVEIRAHPRPWYVAWALCCVLLALVGSRMVQGVTAARSPPARRRLAVVAGLLTAGSGALLWPRLTVFGSTVEYSVGIGRALSTQPKARFILGATLLATLIPLIGAVVLVAIDGLRARRRAVG